MNPTVNATMTMPSSDTERSRSFAMDGPGNAKRPAGQTDQYESGVDKEDPFSHYESRSVAPRSAAWTRAWSLRIPPSQRS